MAGKMLDPSLDKQWKKVVKNSYRLGLITKDEFKLYGQYLGQSGGGKMRFLCRLGFHKWSEWYLHPYHGDRATRHCLKCPKIQDVRL